VCNVIAQFSVPTITGEKHVAISLRAYNPVEVDLGGTKYETVDMPYEASKRFSHLMAEMEEIGDTDAEEARALELLAEGFDLIVKPVGHEKPASEVLTEGVESGAITPRQFLGLWTDVLEAIEAANGTEDRQGSVDRPT
jgi:hypothetical protein